MREIINNYNGKQLEYFVDTMIFPKHIYTGDDAIANALLSHLPLITSEYKEIKDSLGQDGLTEDFMANELILFATPDSLKKAETLKNSDGYFCPSLFIMDREPGFEGWGEGDEKMIEELAIASMVPEVFEDDSYNWQRIFPLYGTNHFGQLGPMNLSKKVQQMDHPSHEEEQEYRSITDEDIRRGRWSDGSGGEPCKDAIAELEWNECCELSLFKEYDQAHYAMDLPASWIVDNHGRATGHNAEYHEQRCALNALYNHPVHDWKTWVGEYHSKPMVRPDLIDWHSLDRKGIHRVKCTLKATGDDFAVSTCDFGAVYVPKHYLALISNRLGDIFYARLKIPRRSDGTITKYPLRVEEIVSC
tara:strand:- start:3740 stop:4819 length:1080 start_codon:yes stop_codon:yes gene_type:complete